MNEQQQVKRVNPQVTRFETRRVIGIGSIGTPVNPTEAWAALLSRIKEIPNRINDVETLGVIKINEQGYLACAEVSLSSSIPEGMISYELPGGSYAAITHRGPVSKMNETFRPLTEWLGDNNYEQQNIICYEVYDHRFKGECDESG